MKVFKFLTLVAIVFFVTSCNSVYYQVYDLQTENLTQRDNSLIYENEDCKVMYNFWSDKGEVKFTFYNKTDKDIFINMEKTFLIINDTARDYHQNRSYTAGCSDNVSTKFGKSTQKTNGRKFEITTKEKEFECIPAKSMKCINKCNINPDVLLTCVKKNDFPSNVTNIKTYEQYTTPYIITNHIAYGFDKESVKLIDNTLWVSKITNYPYKKATESAKSDCYKNYTNKKNRQFVIGGPDKFYITYSKKDILNR